MAISEGMSYPELFSYSLIMIIFSTMEVNIFTKESLTFEDSFALHLRQTNFLLKRNWFTILCQFQVYSKVIQFFVFFSPLVGESEDDVTINELFFSHLFLLVGS